MKNIKFLGNFFKKYPEAVKRIEKTFSSKKEEKEEKEEPNGGYAFVDGTLIICTDDKFFRLKKVGNKVTCVQMTPIKIHREAK